MVQQAMLSNESIRLEVQEVHHGLNHTLGVYIIVQFLLVRDLYALWVRDTDRPR